MRKVLMLLLEHFKATRDNTYYVTEATYQLYKFKRNQTARGQLLISVQVTSKNMRNHAKER